MYGAVALGYQISIFNNRTNLIIRSFLEKISPNPAESQIKLKQNPHASTTENATQKRNATLVPMVNQGAPLPFDASYRKRRLCWSRVLLRGTIVNRTHGTHKNQTLSPKRKKERKKSQANLERNSSNEPGKNNQEKPRKSTTYHSISLEYIGKDVGAGHAYSPVQPNKRITATDQMSACRPS